MKSAMRKGQVLLKKKEEKLSQLESSLLEEVNTSIAVVWACLATFHPAQSSWHPPLGWSLCRAFGPHEGCLAGAQRQAFANRAGS